MVHIDFARVAAESRLRLIRSLVARPWEARCDAEPALVGEGLLVGNKYHAADVGMLTRLGVTAVLNCAPSGIRALPRDEYEERGVRYTSTNVKRDDHTYPILHEAGGARSGHLATALECYAQARAEGGKVLFFCVAGQNRSATLATAVLLLSGEPLEQVLARFAELRPFVLENVGFQQQLVELEACLEPRSPSAAVQPPGADAAKPAPQHVPSVRGAPGSIAMVTDFMGA